jgi:nucleotide sugar dehydrogenase
MILLGYDADSLGLNQNDQVIHDISALYKKIQVTRAIVCQMSTTAAEVTKIAVNCYLTTKISYANMLGDTLHRAGCGAEISSVLSAIGTDSRIGRKFLNWGVGYGGPCLPRDNRAFAAFAESLGMEYNLGRCTDGINNEHAEFIADYWLEMNQSNSPFYFDYISYKHGTDIIEESQQLRLCTDLLDKGAKVYIRNDRRLDEKVYTDLIAKYGHDKVKIVDGKEHITEDIFIVNL